MLAIQNIAGYKFIALANLPEMRVELLDKCLSLAIKGTILLSPEGINMNLAATHDAISHFKAYLLANPHFSDMTFRESLSAESPFKRMKVKLKKEIITMRTPDVNPGEIRAPSISPTDFKQWLDENRDMVVLDTRNDYEMQFGTFDNAVNLHLKDFGEFPEKSKSLTKDKPIVMFCTGGIRCEKAAVHLLNAGFEKVFQLDGGILNYFAEVGGAHYNGECFVFDGRVALNPELQATGAEQCCVCQNPIKKFEDHHCHS
jgi:UPF0176 protein